MKGQAQAAQDHWLGYALPDHFYSLVSMTISGHLVYTPMICHDLSDSSAVILYSVGVY